MKITIYGQDWQIVEAGASACEIAKLDGWCDPTRRTIFLDPNIEGALRREVLLHEITHALFHEHHWPNKKLKEEQVATWLGKALSVFLRENPKFVVDELL